MKKQLPDGRWFEFDEADLDLVSKHSWHALPKGYVGTTIGGRKTKKHFYLHRMIMKAEMGMVVDHLDKNPLNNRRFNLAVCESKTNAHGNVRKKVAHDSPYRGITKTKHRRWSPHISVERKPVNLGQYNDDKIAAIVYDIHAILYFGKHAKTNILPPCDRLISIEVK